MSASEDCLGQRGKADRIVTESERGVNVLHETVPEEPNVVAETKVLASKGTYALPIFSNAEVKAEDAW